MLSFHAYSGDRDEVQKVHGHLISWEIVKAAPSRVEPLYVELKFSVSLSCLIERNGNHYGQPNFMTQNYQYY